MTQDRFKFKVWDLVAKKWLPEDKYHLRNGEVFRTRTDCRISHVKIVQCTGLKDKNGTLIFEGDIVNFEGRLIVLKWNVENKEYFDGERSSTTYVGFSLGLYGLYENSFSKSEIIGNIYENPELLKAGM